MSNSQPERKRTAGSDDTADTDDDIWAAESPTVSGRISQRAAKYHTNANCRQLNRALRITHAEADRRGLDLCAYCFGEIESGTYEKKYAWDIRGMDDDERAALAQAIGDGGDA